MCLLLCCKAGDSQALLLTITATAVGAEPVPSVAGALVASSIVVTVLLTAVRTVITFIDI